MEELAAKARLPSFFPPVFSLSGHSRGRARDRAPRREAVDPRLSGPLPGVFFVSPAPRCARQADARALRQELDRLKAHPSTVEIVRPRFRVRGLHRRRRSGLGKDPPPSFSFPSEPSRSIPRRTVSPTRPTSTRWRTWPFFFQCRAGT